MARTHDYLAAPSPEQVAELAARLTEAVRGAYLATHRLVVDTLPDLVCELDLRTLQVRYGNRQFGYNGWGLGALSPASKWVGLYFMAGVRLPDPAGVLEGSGAGMRHVKLRTAERVDQLAPVLRALLRAAAEVHTAP
jgi:hypothetical protein